MQTFLTHYSDDPKLVFMMTAKHLDWQRLGKQRVEAFQIIRTLTGQSEGWSNHPATRMWDGNVALLTLYQDAMIKEWIGRGYKNTMSYLQGIYGDLKHLEYPKMPEWFTPELVRTHRSNLIRKKPEWYAPMWPDVPNDLEYIWPVSK